MNSSITATWSTLKSRKYIRIMFILLILPGLLPGCFNGFEQGLGKALQRHFEENPELLIRMIVISGLEDICFPEFTEDDLFLFVESVPDSHEILIYHVFGSRARAELLGDAIVFPPHLRAMVWEEHLLRTSESRICADLARVIQSLSVERKVALGVLEGNELGVYLENECDWADRTIDFILVPDLSAFCVTTRAGTALEDSHKNE